MQVFPVLPIIDVNTGQLQFRCRGQWLQYFTDRPRELLRLLDRSSRPARFDPQQDRLLLTVAANRSMSGREITFSLAKFPLTPGITRLDGDGVPLPSAVEAPYRV